MVLLNTLIYALLAFQISIEYSAVILMSLLSYIIHFFSLTDFNILSLFSMLVVLVIICHGKVLFWSCLFGVMELHVRKWANLS
jgi:hypothetical protein